MSPERQERLLAALVTLAFFGLSAFVIGWGAWSLGTSLIGWMKHGQWDHGTIGDTLSTLGLGHPTLSWVGLDNLLQWVLDLPQWIGFVPVGIWAVLTTQHLGLESDRLAETRIDN